MTGLIIFGMYYLVIGFALLENSFKEFAEEEKRNAATWALYLTFATCLLCWPAFVVSALWNTEHKVWIIVTTPILIALLLVMTLITEGFIS